MDSSRESLILSARGSRRRWSPNTCFDLTRERKGLSVNLFRGQKIKDQGHRVTKCKSIALSNRYVRVYMLRECKGTATLQQPAVPLESLIQLYTVRRPSGRYELCTTHFTGRGNYNVLKITLLLSLWQTLQQLSFVWYSKKNPTILSENYTFLDF